MVATGPYGSVAYTWFVASIIKKNQYRIIFFLLRTFTALVSLMIPALSYMWGREYPSEEAELMSAALLAIQSEYQKLELR